MLGTVLLKSTWSSTRSGHWVNGLLVQPVGHWPVDSVILKHITNIYIYIYNIYFHNIHEHQSSPAAESTSQGASLPEFNPSHGYFAEFS